MAILQQASIKEVAREIADGNTCYIHKSTRDIFTIDNTTEDDATIAKQDLMVTEIENKIDNYLKLETPSTEDQLIIMGNFLEEIPDKSIRKQLSNALNRKNPIRNFTQVIDSDMELTQHWRFFSFVAYQQWVADFIIDAYNY